MKTLKEKYHYLKESNGYTDGKIVAANIRIELKLAFPGQKFSVRKAHHGCVNVRWTDGPTEGQVKTITDKYQPGYFDGMTDCYEYRRSAFSDMFGEVRFLFTDREYSKEFKADCGLTPELEKYYYTDPEKEFAYRRAYNKLRETSR